MSRDKHLPENISHLAPAFLVLALAALGFVFIGYRPFRTLASEQSLRAFNQGPMNGQTVGLIQRAVELSPDNCQAYLRLAITYGGMAIPGDQKTAGYDISLAQKSVEAFRSLIRRCPGTLEELDAHFILGEEYVRMGMPQQALGEYQSFVAAEPNTLRGAISLATAYRRMSEIYAGIGDVQQAFDALKRAVLNEPDRDTSLRHVHQLNAYLASSPALSSSLGPGRPLGFGRYLSSTETRDGTIHLIATDKNDPQLVLYATSQDGRQWIPQVLTVDKNPIGALSIDPMGDIHIAYSVKDNAIVHADSRNGLDRRVVIDVTKARAPVTLPGQGLDRIDSLQIATDGVGRSYLVWGYANTQLGYAVVDQHVDQHIANVPAVIASNASVPDVKVSPSGSIYVVYNNPDPFPEANTQVWFLEGRGGQWSSPSRISETGQWAGGATLALQPNGSIHVIYLTGQSADTVRLMHVSRNPAGEWSKPVVVGDGQYRPWIPATNKVSFGGRTAPSVLVLSNNKLLVVWRGALEQGASRIASRELENGTWGPISFLGTISGDDYRDTQSFVSLEDSGVRFKILWADAGRLILREW